MEKKSIDIAIDACIEKVTEHQKKATRFLWIIIGVLLAFVFAYIMPLYLIYRNQAGLKHFQSDVRTNAAKIEKMIPKTNDYYESLKSAIDEMKDTLSRPGVVVLKLTAHIAGDEKIKAILDNLKREDTTYREMLSSLKELPESIDKDIYSVDHTSTYIIYGIFILIFGVITSFYRHHIKEIAKFEHYRIAFERIRIAGYNSTTKYDGEVLKALTSDAFAIESKPAGKSKIESPIPGHPTSDISTLVLNKLLEAVDVIPKPKSPPVGQKNETEV